MPKPPLPALARLWPRHLRHQMLLLLATIMVISMALLYRVSIHRLADVASDATRQWAEAVARTAASSGSTTLAGKDYATLETTLRDIVSLPGVSRIDVVDGGRRPLLSLLNSPDGRVQVRYRGTDVSLPSPGEPATRQLSVAGRQAIQSWAPVGLDGSLGRVGVTFNLDTERERMASLRYDAVASIAFVGAVTLLSAYALLFHALSPLQRLARFSRGLAGSHGSTLSQRAGSQEVEDLTEALNDASTALHARLAEIHASEARTQAILNAVPDAIIGFDDEGRVSTISPAAASVFGWDCASMGWPRLDDLLPCIDAAEAERRTRDGLYMRASQSRIARFEATARRVDGTEFPVDVSLARVEGGDGVRYTCVVRDITEQRMAYSMLNLYQRALECTTNGVVISDMSMPLQPVFYANPAFFRITGYEPAEIIGRNCTVLQGTDTAQPQVGQLREAVARGGSCTVVLRNYRKDGTLFFNELAIAPVANASGAVAHYVGVLNDVTERERARLALAERSARLNAVFDLSPDGFVVFDREHQLVYCNRSFQAMTGWDDAAGGISLMTLRDFDQSFSRLCDPAQAFTPVAKALDGAQGASEVLTLHRPQQRVLARTVKVQAEGSGEIILFFRDITHETEVDRMKSEFLTTAAHELRTPMVSVFGFTELLLNRPLSEERRRDMLETIHRQASLLINMVNELLDLARIEARQGKDLRMEPCPLGRLIEEAAAPFTKEGGRHRLRVTLDHAQALVRVDPEKTHRVLTNVLSNAFKYSPDGGDVRVSTLKGELRGLPALGVRVSDEGIGMTPEQLARVFERFYRADPSGNIPGTGLGMSLVKEITELQGGRVELFSARGQGTVVTLWWLCSPSAQPRDHEAPRVG